ncbi:ribulose-phosphate 3-epimerase [Aureococcus anophagefferens]|nr:ribulose-phosphate 3-epimerase [Aureococcus anophagefferens]
MFETQLMVSERCTDAMLPQFTECTKGPNGEPGVVIVHAEACTHLHRALSNIRAMGGPLRRAQPVHARGRHR